MWTRRGGLAVATVIVAAIAAPAVAQQGPGGARRGPDLDRRMEMLTEELALSDEQAASVRAILEEQGERGREAMRAAGRDRRALRSAMEDIRRETAGRLAEVLDETQMERFRELQERRAGRRPPRGRPPA